MDFNRLRYSIEAHEGFRSQPYRDTEGILTGGYGRNLEAIPFSQDEAQLMLANDIRRAWHGAREVINCFDVVDDVRQEVLVEMCFNLGEQGLRGFRLMRQALEVGDFETTADEMVDSQWYRQIGLRGPVLERRMRTGRW